MNLHNPAYRNQWWVLDIERGLMTATGIHGQSLVVDAENEVVIAKFSTQPEAQDITRFLKKA